MTLSEKNILLHSYILTVHNMHDKGGGRRFGMGVEKHRGSGDGSTPAGSRGTALVGSLGTKSPEAEEF